MQDPGFVPAFKVKRWIFSAKGDLNSARESLERERLLSGGDASLPGWQIISLQLSDIDPDSKRTSLETLEKVVRDDDIRTNPFTYSVEIALAYLHLGDRENALKWLSKAEATGTHSFNLIDADPRFSELRRDPRFEELTSTLKRK
jgi:tetratricopeptide (TPR) repeat protein